MKIHKLVFCDSDMCFLDIATHFELPLIKMNAAIFLLLSSYCNLDPRREFYTENIFHNL